MLTFHLDLELQHTLMHAHLETIVCKFGGDPAICLVEETVCAKIYRQTDDGRRAMALAHWNDLTKMSLVTAGTDWKISPHL